MKKGKGKAMDGVEIREWAARKGRTWSKRFEYVPKSPGFKIAVRWGKEGGVSFYFGTNTHPWGKVYFFWW